MPSTNCSKRFRGHVQQCCVHGPDTCEPPPNTPYNPARHPLVSHFAHRLLLPLVSGLIPVRREGVLPRTLSRHLSASPPRASAPASRVGADPASLDNLLIYLCEFGLVDGGADDLGSLEADVPYAQVVADEQVLDMHELGRRHLERRTQLDLGLREEIDSCRWARGCRLDRERETWGNTRRATYRHIDIVVRPDAHTTQTHTQHAHKTRRSSLHRHLH